MVVPLVSGPSHNWNLVYFFERDGIPTHTNPERAPWFPDSTL